MEYYRYELGNSM